MIRAAIQTNKGPIGLIGIDYGNLVRLKAGMPLDIDLDHITPPGTKMRRVLVHYAHTYEEIVDDLAKGDIPINDEIRQIARNLDKKRKEERTNAG